MPFILQQSHANNTNEWFDFNHCIYSDPEAANTEAQEYNDYYTAVRSSPIRIRVQELSLDDDRCWRFREKLKLEDGTHKRTPWEPNPDYYEHIDPNKPTMVRFFRDEKDALRGRYTSMAVGRFLTRFHSFPQGMIEKYCAEVGLDSEVSKLHVVKSADEFERVYVNGPHSCMAYEAKEGRYGGENEHPVRLYADLDLAVAYIERFGEITARCLVWPEKKIHGRIYGDKERLLLRLKEEGYTEDWNFSGARLHLKYTEYKEIRAPYVDGELHGRISECGKYIILGQYEGNLVLHSDSGTIYTDRCGDCGTETGPFSWCDGHEAYTCDDCHGTSVDYD